MALLTLNLRIYIILMSAVVAVQNIKSGTTGKDFYFGILDLVDDIYRNGKNIITAYVTNVSPQEAQVRLQIPYLNVDTTYNITRGQGQGFNISNRIQEEGIFNDARGIRISSNNDINLIVTNSYSTSIMMDVYNVLPTTSIGKQYVILSNIGDNDPNRGSAFLVTGVFDNTNLTVTINSISHDVILNAFDVYQYVCGYRCDLSGALLDSDKDISVTAGSTYTVTSIHDDYIASEIIPTSAWETAYIVPPLLPKHGFTVRAVSDYESLINISNTTQAFSSQHSTQEMIFDDLPVLVTSSKPFSVAQYSFISPGNNLGDIFMAVVPGIKQYMNSYLFTVPHAYYGNTSAYVALIVPWKEKDSLMLDSQSMQLYNTSKGDVKQLSVPHPYEHYTVLTFQTTEGVHHFWHPHKTVTFGVLVYGLGFRLGYGFYAGYNLGFHESATMCYNCNDVTHVGLCDNVQKCADNEICYVESYTVSGHTKYRSGCRDASTCEADQAVAIQSGKFCLECCNKDFCNNQGCGEVIPDRNSRGPICFHCDHVSSPDECFQVEPCQSFEVCKIEKYSWFNVDFHYKMSCGHKQCNSATRSTHNSHVEKRATLLCNNCCSDDYCNRNCTQESDVNTGPSIIG